MTGGGEGWWTARPATLPGAAEFEAARWATKASTASRPWSHPPRARDRELAGAEIEDETETS